jgi:hypothetical protein
MKKATRPSSSGGHGALTGALSKRLGRRTLFEGALPTGPLVVGAPTL